MISLDTVKEVYSDIYFSVYGDEYAFTNKRVEKSLNNFISYIPDSADRVWIKDFIIFQFAYYSGMKHRFGRVYLNWILGEKAKKRWDNRTEADLYYANKYKVKIGVKDALFKISIKEFSKKERLRFIDKNTSRQMLHCYELSLFDVEDCTACVNYEKCSRGYL